MKQHTIFIGVGLIGLLALFWWCMADSNGNSGNPSTVKIPSPKQIAPASSATPNADSWIGRSDVQMPADREPGYDPSLPQWAEWRRRRAEDRDFEWKMPINFWGKVVDQDGLSVAGAKIRYGWNSMNGSNERFDASDGQGLFSITGIKGKILSVRVSKEGYHAGKESFGGFEYAAFFEGHYHQPDPNHPVIFRLIKKLEGEPLIAGRVHHELKYDLAPFYYDLEKTKLTRGIPKVGIKVNFTRTWTPQGKPFDWSFTVEGINAGLLPTSDEFAQIAPTEGYTNQWQVSQSATAERFEQGAKTRLYMRTNDGRYAVVDLVYAQANKREAGPYLTVKSLFNPSGSRNLEYDKAKVINRFSNYK